MKNIALALSLLTLIGCVASQHPTKQSPLGVARSSDDLVALLDKPGPITLETVESAEWSVPLSGLVNLENERAKSAGLAERDEPIVIPFHVIRHPERGLFIVDTGVERAVHDPEKAAVRGLVADVMKVEKIAVKRDLATFLAEEPTPLTGVLLTHLHLDHVMGLPDVPKRTPIYAGPGETTATQATNIVVAANVDRALAGHAPLSEWKYARDSAGRFDGVIDIFGDGSLWAIWVPGHTPGSTAYLVRTTKGPVLLTGDASHTRWGWENDVEPGTYSLDPEQSAASFHKLRAFIEKHPTVEVRVGHQH